MQSLVFWHIAPAIRPTASAKNIGACIEPGPSVENTRRVELTASNMNKNTHIAGIINPSNLDCL